MHINRKLLLIVLVAAILPVLLLPGCASPAYYSQAISGHLGLMRNREDIEALIRSADIDPQLKQRLALSQEMRHFAVTALGLPDNDSYSQFVQTGQDAVSWNVVAAEEFSLQARQWCFVVAGCVPYRGYFNRDSAEKFATKLAADGFDTSISPATAYSTLGWFDDPLLDTMFRYSDEQLAATLFHELAHQMLYVKGDTAFNEAYAGFVEEWGVRLWLDARGQSDRLPAWKDQQQASLQFNALLQQHRHALDAIYQQDLPPGQMRQLKAEQFEKLQADYRKQVDNNWQGRDYYGGWFDQELNNARLVLISSYQAGSCAFSNLQEDSEGSLPRFHQLAKQQSRLDASARKAWLEQACDSVALQPDL